MSPPASWGQGLLDVWIDDVTAESTTWDPSGAPASNPSDPGQSGHVSGTLRGHPATVRRTRDDRTSVTTVLHAGHDVLSLEMTSGLEPQRAITAAEYALPG